MVFYKGHKVYMNGKYPAVCINGKNVHVHRLVWEDNFGKIPTGYVIHHKDENKLNWDINNLELLSRKDHIREHKDIVHRKGVKVIGIKSDIVIIFNSIEEASIKCHTYTSNIQRILNGKQKTAKGWTFRKE